MQMNWQGKRVLVCKKCGSLMIKSSFYDPEGSVPLYGGGKQCSSDGLLNDWWVCLNSSCEEGL